jgi:hypothetical protein
MSSRLPELDCVTRSLKTLWQAAKNLIRVFEAQHYEAKHYEAKQKEMNGY